jgi:hypothetical protein
MKILARFRKPDPGTICDPIGGHEAIEVLVGRAEIAVRAAVRAGPTTTTAAISPVTAPQRGEGGRHD